MRFLIDAQLPPALAELIRGEGFDAEHLVEMGKESASDERLWELALEAGYVIVTKDEDFAHRQNQSDKPSPVIVWIRLGNVSKKALLEWFAPLLDGIVKLIKEGNRLVEIR